MIAAKVRKIAPFFLVLVPLLIYNSINKKKGRSS